jgi:predicted transposase/invertase (TIGR01784 family)
VHEADKFNRVDILVSDDSGELFIIELQFSYEIDYFQRMVYGTSKALVERMRSGDEYAEVKKVYSINIVYFDLGMGEDYVYHGKTHFIGLHDGNELKLSPYQQKQFNKLTPAELLPEYYILKVNRFNDLAKTPLDEWVYYLKNNRVLDGFTAPGLKKAEELLNEAMLSEEERWAYDKAIDIRRSNQSSLNSARFIGLQDGREEGLEKGQNLKEREIVIRSHQAGLDTATISSITGLSEEEIKRIIFERR